MSCRLAVYIGKVSMSGSGWAVFYGFVIENGFYNLLCPFGPASQADDVGDGDDDLGG